MSYSAIMVVFQPTRPLRGATGIPFGRIAGLVFQPTRPLRGATMDFCNNYRYIQISTHAPLAGRDHKLHPYNKQGRISTHAPLAGRDLTLRSRDLQLFIFQPTRPLRGATIFIFTKLLGTKISTHAPLAGRDCLVCRTSSNPTHFNPRAPCGARQQKCTNHYAHFCDNRQISDVFAQNADCQGILFLFCARKTCKF